MLFDCMYDFLYNIYLILPLPYKHLCENFLEQLCSFLSAFTGTFEKHVCCMSNHCMGGGGPFWGGGGGGWHMNICRCKSYLLLERLKK